jgi:hypothetical protein
MVARVLGNGREMPKFYLAFKPGAVRFLAFYLGTVIL